MGRLRWSRSSRSVERFRGRTSFFVTVTLALGVTGLTAGASAATNAGTRIEGVEGASSLQKAAVAEKAPLATLRSAFAAHNRAMMHRTNVRPTARALSTAAGVRRYLRTIGMNPAGVVIQRGRWNYAGPNCPGRGWTCTRATRVVQIAGTNTGRSLATSTSAKAQNRVVCNPGVATDTPAGLPGPGKTCVIVQATPPSGDNVATCILENYNPATSQGCSILQSNSKGRNRAVLQELARQTEVPAQQFEGFDQIAIQVADVTQLNDTGNNDASVTQRIDQRIMAGGDGTTAVHTTGAAHSIDFYQQGTGANRGSIDEEYGQNVNDLAPKVTDIELGIQGITAVQCGASSGTCVNGAGNQTLNMRESFSQAMTAPKATDGFQAQEAAPATDSDDCVVPSNPDDAASVCGTVNQLGAGVSRAWVTQTGVQRATAPKTSLVAERQNDPFRCCTGDPLAQEVNPNNHFELSQDRTQLANSNIYLQLADSMEGSCLTSGTCAARQRANENGAITLNSCTGTSCDIFIDCPSTGAACTASSAPPPTPLVRRRL